MIGRDLEISEVTRSMADGAVRGVALAGKAGVGKSRLAREAALAAEAAGWTVRTIAATATSRPVPLGAFSPWTDDVESAPFALVRRVIEVLTDGAEPDRLVVFVDDAHLLDDLSALVLHQLVQSQAAAVILTIRTGEAGEVYVGHPLYAEVRLNRCGSSRLRRLRGQVATAMKDGGHHGIYGGSGGRFGRQQRPAIWSRPRRLGWAGRQLVSPQQ